jgi:hypothetical protein
MIGLFIRRIAPQEVKRYTPYERIPGKPIALKALLIRGFAEISKYGSLGNEMVAFRTKGGVADNRSLTLIVPVILSMSM